jgi:hypothetical protein
LSGGTEEGHETFRKDSSSYYRLRRWDRLYKKRELSLLTVMFGELVLLANAI